MKSVKTLEDLNDTELSFAVGVAMREIVNRIVNGYRFGDPVVDKKIEQVLTTKHRNEDELASKLARVSLDYMQKLAFMILKNSIFPDGKNNIIMLNYEILQNEKERN